VHERTAINPGAGSQACDIPNIPGQEFFTTDPASLKLRRTGFTEPMIGSNTDEVRKG
jgi:hypothetical protein